jgi:hypothetical protein
MSGFQAGQCKQTQFFKNNFFPAPHITKEQDLRLGLLTVIFKITTELERKG